MTTGFWFRMPLNAVSCAHTCSVWMCRELELMVMCRVTNRFIFFSKELRNIAQLTQQRFHVERLKSKSLWCHDLSFIQACSLKYSIIGIKCTKFVLLQPKSFPESLVLCVTFWEQSFRVLFGLRHIILLFLCQTSPALLLGHIIRTLMPLNRRRSSSLHPYSLLTSSRSSSTKTLEFL